MISYSIDIFRILMYSTSFPPPQLGVLNSYLMMSYQYKFQDEDQTKVKGSLKYVRAQSSECQSSV